MTILPLGDSITEGTLARPNLYQGRPNYRVKLGELLGKKGVKFEMVGPRTTCDLDECGVAVKEAWRHHQGISGYRIFSGNGRKGYLETIDDDLKSLRLGPKRLSHKM